MALCSKAIIETPWELELYTVYPKIRLKYCNILEASMTSIAICEAYYCLPSTTTSIKLLYHSVGIPETTVHHKKQIVRVDSNSHVSAFISF